MKTFMAAAALAATVMVGSALPSSAASLGTFSADGAANFGNNVAKNTTFSDFYTFTLTKFADVSVGLTNSFASAGQKIKNFVLTVDGMAGSTFSIGKTQYASYDSTTSFGPGTYTIEVQGTGGSQDGSYGGSLTVAVSAVPLPTSVALFGAAIVGLGAAGALRKKSKGATASA